MSGGSYEGRFKYCTLPLLLGLIEHSLDLTLANDMKLARSCVRGTANEFSLQINGLTVRTHQRREISQAGHCVSCLIPCLYSTANPHCLSLRANQISTEASITFSCCFFYLCRYKHKHTRCPTQSPDQYVMGITLSR